MELIELDNEHAELIRVLQRLPGQLFEAELTLINKQEELDQAKAILDQQMNRLWVEIIGETNDDGKPTYRNERERALAHAAKSQEPDCLALQARVTEAQHELLKSKASYALIFHRLQAFRAIAGIV